MGYIVDANGHLQYTHRAIVQIDCPTTLSGTTVGAGEIGTTELAANAVTTAKITDANVTTAKIADDAITTAKILNANVTTGKLASGAATLPKVTFTGLKLLAADGVDSSGGDTQVTLTGSAVGDRVIAIFGQTKDETSANTFLIPTIGTHFEATISVVDKIVQKTAAGHLETKTYLFILAPAAA